MSSPTQRTLAELKKRGYIVAITEHWNPFARLKKDLFGFIDVLGLKRGETLAIQATSDSNVSARIAKINSLETARAWIEAGNKISVWGWGKKGARGKRKVWTLREVPIE